jgi:adenylate cyclase
MRERLFGGASASRVKSLAVLPFDNLSDDPEQAYFSDGMTEEIISKLSRIDKLNVASRTSVKQYKGTKKDVKEIGEELQVRYVLEGSVRKAEQRVRILAQLIDTSTGFNLWSEDYEEDLSDIFAVQENTAIKIASALNLRLSPEEEQAIRHRLTTDPAAYDAYLRGQALVQFYDDPQKLIAARRHFEKALELDADYAPALAGLATVDMEFDRNVAPSEARRRHAYQLAERALALEPELARAHIAMGQVYVGTYEYVRAEEEFRIAIRLVPDDSYAWDLLAWSLVYQQPPDAEGAEQAARESIRLRPNWPGPHYHLGLALIHQDRLEEAVEAFKHDKELAPASAIPDYGLALVDLAAGRYDLAISKIQALPKLNPPVMHYSLSVANAARNNPGQALVELEKSLAVGFRDFAAIQANRHLQSLRSEQRFQDLLKLYRVQSATRVGDDNTE